MVLKGFSRHSLAAVVGGVATLSSVVHGQHNPALDAPISSHRSYNFSVPVDHFHNDSRYEPHSDDFYPLRYWLNTDHFEPGGPVILLHSGEFSGDARIPYLEHGIADILAKATNGLAVLLEHRYYGTSQPFPDLAVDNLRFLTTDQALADTAYFASNIRYPGFEHLDLTAEDTPYILYGGSYAGGFVSFARKVYPEVFWGAISSSGVTYVYDEFWQYFEAARLYAPGQCAEMTQKLTHMIDTVLLGKDDARRKKLKDAFGLGDLNNGDFGFTLARGIYGFQSTVWDPEVDATDFAYYCASITSDTPLFPNTRHLLPHAKEVAALGGYSAESESFATRLVNYIGYMQAHIVEDLTQGLCKNLTVAKCYAKEGAIDDIQVPQFFQRAWAYQTCDEWGYWVTGSGVPEGQLPLISRAVDYSYVTQWCRDVFNITRQPNTENINKHGGFNMSYPRLAMLDGEHDPWRAAGTHAIGFTDPDRESTVSEPFILVDAATHHWDEYGLANDAYGPNLPPPQVKKAQQAEVDFVKAWIEEWKEEGRNADTSNGSPDLGQEVLEPGEL